MDWLAFEPRESNNIGPEPPFPSLATINSLENMRRVTMFPGMMSPGVYLALGIVLGIVISIAIGNAFIGVGVGAIIGIAWYFGQRALATRRRP